MPASDIVSLLNGAPGALDPALLLLVALALDALIGDPPWLWRVLPHPVALIGKPIGWLERKLNRAERSAVNRTIRGALATAATVGAAAAAGWGLHGLLADLPYGMAGEALIVVVLLAGRSLYGHVRAVAHALETQGLEGGRDAVRHIVGRDPDGLDKHGVARAAIESLAENFADGLAAPAFWYLLLGLPGLFAYKAINTADSMIGYRSARYKAYGLVAARLDDAANYLPARLSGLLIGLAAAFAPGARAGRALNIMVKHSGAHASPNAGWPEAAMAGALDLALGGPRRYPGGVSEAAWIGVGRARLVGRDIRAALRLYLITWLLCWLAVAGVALTGL